MGGGARQERSQWKRLVKMLLGQGLYSLAISLTIRANIGYCPWDVFHSGVAQVLGISIGGAITAVSAALLGMALVKRWPIGLGTVLNVFLCGTLVDVYCPLLPAAKGWASGVGMFVLGIAVLAFATYCYIEPAYGTSVRDSLFVFIAKSLRISTGRARILMEVCLVALGLLMGGTAGAGSLLSCVITGPCMQVMFKALRFELVTVNHESLADTLRFLKRTR